MNCRAAIALGFALTLPLCGCGGGVPPGFGTMSSSDVRAPGLQSPALARRPAAQKLWEVERLRRAPLGTQVLSDRQETAGEAHLTWREVTFNSEVMPGSPERLFAIFAFPARKPGENSEPRLPAVVLVHDLSQTASEDAVRQWAARGYAALALDLPGKGPGREKSRSTGPEMTEEALFKVSGGARDSYLFRAVGAVVRAVGFLREQKEVDPRKIALVGESWGGVTAALAGSIDDRAHAVVAVYGAGSLQRGTPAAAHLKSMTPKDRDTWTKAFDVVAYSRSDQPAVLLAGTTNDKTWEPESLVDTLHRYNGPRWLALTPGKDHELDTPARTAIGEWLDQVLKGAEPSAGAAVLTTEDGKWVARTSGRQPARVVSFYYAPGTGDWNQREWKEVKATRADEHRWTAAIPDGAEGAPLLVRVHDASGAALTAEPSPQAPRRAGTPATPPKGG